MSQDDVDPRDFAFYERVAGRVAADQIVATYLDLTAKAFDACVHGFTGGRLSEKEGRCIGNVTKKYLAHHGRVTSRCVLRARRVWRVRRSQRHAAARAHAAGKGAATTTPPAARPCARCLSRPRCCSFTESQNSYTQAQLDAAEKARSEVRRGGAAAGERSAGRHRCVWPGTHTHCTPPAAAVSSVAAASQDRRVDGEERGARAGGGGRGARQQRRRGSGRAREMMRASCNTACYR